MYFLDAGIRSNVYELKQVLLESLFSELKS